MRRYQAPLEGGPTSNVWDDYESALAAYALEPTPKRADQLEALRQIYRRRLAVEAWRAPGPQGYPWEALEEDAGPLARRPASG